jgi:hypothetical protein
LAGSATFRRPLPSDRKNANTSPHDVNADASTKRRDLAPARPPPRPPKSGKTGTPSATAGTSQRQRHAAALANWNPVTDRHHCDHEHGRERSAGTLSQAEDVLRS